MTEAWKDINGDEPVFVLDSTLTDNKGIDTDDILYYTYTYTGTNKQVVINTVTFKVKDGDGFYRATATVNKSLTFDYE
ncbi:MAG: hypothetical protein IKL28_05760 [Lachnospiraceae bacterium]|nr:hypothetical protein [Lachnospiraceae bacterium]